MSSVIIANPTLRKIRNRGFTPIRYRTPNNDGARTGYIIKRPKRRNGKTVIYLIGDKRIRSISSDELQYIEELDA